MNRIFRIAIIITTLLLSPAAFAANETVDFKADKKNKQDIIILDVTKTNQDGTVDETINEPVKKSRRLKFDKGEIDEQDRAQDNADVEFSIFDNLIDKDADSDHPLKIEEESLFGRIYKKKLERTSIPSFLLQEELTHKFKKGPVDKVQFYGAYQGNFNSAFNGGDYDTEYDFGIMDVGAVGDFKNKRNSFKVQLNLKPSSKSTYLQGLVTDAYVMNTSIPHHKIIIGNSRNQIGVEGGASSYTLPFVMRSQISRNFSSTRALGVRVVGNYSLADYSLALNSSDRYFREFFPGIEFTGWVNFKPLGKTDGRYGNLVLGGGLNAGHNNTNYTVGGAYANYTYKRFMANFEYSIADGYNGSYVSTDKATGFYTTVSYRLTKKLHVLARYDQFDPNRSINGDMRREYTTGLNYFIKGQAMRIILNYVFCQNERQPDSHRIILGTQILL